MGHSRDVIGGGHLQVSSRDQHHNHSRVLNKLQFRSPLTANIYFPAIPTLADAFHKSVELINLTVTMYMVLQGICEYAELLSYGADLRKGQQHRCSGVRLGTGGAEGPCSLHASLYWPSHASDLLAFPQTHIGF